MQGSRELKRSDLKHYLIKAILKIPQSENISIIPHKDKRELLAAIDTDLSREKQDFILKLNLLLDELNQEDIDSKQDIQQLRDILAFTIFSYQSLPLPSEEESLKHLQKLNKLLLWMDNYLNPNFLPSHEKEKEKENVPPILRAKSKPEGIEKFKFNSALGKFSKQLRDMLLEIRVEEIGFDLSTYLNLSDYLQTTTTLKLSNQKKLNEEQKLFLESLCLLANTISLLNLKDEDKISLVDIKSLKICIQQVLFHLNSVSSQLPSSDENLDKLLAKESPWLNLVNFLAQKTTRINDKIDSLQQKETKGKKKKNNSSSISIFGMVGAIFRAFNTHANNPEQGISNSSDPTTEKSSRKLTNEEKNILLLKNINVINQYFTDRAKETSGFFGNLVGKNSAKHYYDRRDSWKEILRQLLELLENPGDRQTRLALQTYIQEQIRKFRRKFRSDEYVTKLEELRDSILLISNPESDLNAEKSVDTIERISTYYEMYDIMDQYRYKASQYIEGFSFFSKNKSQEKDVLLQRASYTLCYNFVLHEEDRKYFQRPDEEHLSEYKNSQYAPLKKAS